MSNLSGRFVILATLAVVSIGYIVAWVSSGRSTPAGAAERDGSTKLGSLLRVATGFVTNFLDTLGIGSFATTTTLFKLGRMVPDEQIPGTMNVGHTLPTIAQAFIYITLVQVDLTTLTLLIAGAVAGAWCGAGLVAGLPRRAIQLGVGIGLLAAVVFMLTRELHWFPPGGDRLALGGAALAAGIAGTFVFGALSTIGIGFYAPCMIMVSLLGMPPLLAFPIMMGSSAFLMPVASLRFVKSRAYNARTAWALTLGGLPAVLIAAYLVKSLPLETLRRGVMVLALWAAFLLLRSAYLEWNRHAA